MFCKFNPDYVNNTTNKGIMNFIKKIKNTSDLSEENSRKKMVEILEINLSQTAGCFSRVAYLVGFS